MGIGNREAEGEKTRRAGGKIGGREIEKKRAESMLRGI